MMRKSVRLFLGLLMAAVLMIPCLAFADGWRHTEAANGEEITGYSGTEQDVEIPAQTGNGRKVVAIGERIFAGCEQRIRDRRECLRGPGRCDPGRRPRKHGRSVCERKQIQVYVPPGLD